MTLMMILTTNVSLNGASLPTSVYCAAEDTPRMVFQTISHNYPKSQELRQDAGSECDS